MQEIRAKSILSTQNGLNPYRKRQSGLAAFVSGSGMKRLASVPKEGEVKINAPELLENSLRRKRGKCMIIIGGTEEAYPPEEKAYELTRRCLELIERYGFGVAIQSNSALLLRDLDLLKSIRRKTRCTVEMSLCAVDDLMGKKLEPDCSETSERVKVLHALRDAGIPTSVCLTPFFPFLNDGFSNFQTLLEICVEAGVYGLYHRDFDIVLKEREKSGFYKTLNETFPGYAEKYREYYGDSNVLLLPEKAGLEEVYLKTCESYHIWNKAERIFTYRHAFVDRNAGEQLNLFDLFPDA